MSGNAPKPLLQPENLDRFDPLTMSHWTLPMVLTWVIWRDLKRVRGQCKLYDWYLRDANRSKDPADETVASLPPTRLKHLHNLLLETEDPHLPQTFRVPGPAARDGLWHKLGTGTIVATGIPLGGTSRRAIDCAEWVDLDAFDTDGATSNWPVDAIGKGLGHGNGIRFTSVRVASESVVAAWPRLNMSSAAKPPKRRGPRNKYDWKEAEQFLHQILDQNGDYDENGQADDWCCQADAERAVAEHLTVDGNGPSESIVRPHVLEIVEIWRELQRKKEGL